VAAAVGDGGLVEVAVEEEPPQGVLAAGRAAVEADAVEVEGRVGRGGGAEPGDAVGEAGVGQVAPSDVVEGLRPPVGAHAVDLDDDEAELGQGLGAVDG